MPTLKITVIHQWWLETEELAQVLFSGDAALIESRFYPRVTDSPHPTFDITSVSHTIPL